MLKDGEWQEWRKAGLTNLILYDNGFINADATGGYSPSGTYDSYSIDNSGTLYFYSRQKGGTGFLETVKKLDLRGYSKLKILVYNANVTYGSVSVYVANDSYRPNAEVTILPINGGSFSNREFELNIEAIEYGYVGIKIYSGGTYSSQYADVHISKIWTE